MTEIPSRVGLRRVGYASSERRRQLWLYKRTSVKSWVLNELEGTSSLPANCHQRPVLGFAIMICPAVGKSEDRKRGNLTSRSRPDQD